MLYFILILKILLKMQKLINKKLKLKKQITQNGYNNLKDLNLVKLKRNI